MCDTFIALHTQTKNKSIIFGKNSDREPNEAQGIVFFPRKQKCPPRVKCTYIEIEATPNTNSVILSKPIWMWGAEMGVNEHGVVIGNEAVFTKFKKKKNNDGLTGMDLLRLALERSQTAAEARDCIIDLLEKYGQNACGGYENKDFYYDNSYLIADYDTAYILETADRHWAWRRAMAADSISNGLTITTNYEAVSENAINVAQQKGWYSAGKPFSFAQAFKDPLMQWASACVTRQNISKTKTSNKSSFQVADAFTVLQSHFVTDNFLPRNSTTKDICMHATGMLSPSHTVGSLVVELLPNRTMQVWATGSSNPCLSLFKPFAAHQIFNETAPKVFVPDFWHQSEKYLRFFCENYTQIQPIIREKLDVLQVELLNMAESQMFTNFFFEEYAHKQLSIYSSVFAEYKNRKIGLLHKLTSPLYHMYWSKQNKNLNV